MTLETFFVAILWWVVFALIVCLIAWLVTYIVSLFDPNPITPAINKIVWSIALIIVLIGLIYTITGHTLLSFPIR